MNKSIAIDGPAGAGKSTVAKGLAAGLGMVYVDTGAMYRTIGLFCIQSGIDLEDEEAVSKAAEQADISLACTDGAQKIFLGGVDVSSTIRQNEVGNAASVVSRYPVVRRHLVDMQRDIAREQAVVMDGRDIGTVVLPDALLKIFLTADPRERAKRRVGELAAKGIEADIDQIEAEIRERDERDANREVSPLKQADDAVLVDTTNMGIEEAIAYLSGLYKERV